MRESEGELRQDLRTTLRLWAGAENSRPTHGQQDGMLIHHQAQTDFTLHMLSICRKYGVMVQGTKKKVNQKRMN